MTNHLQCCSLGILQVLQVFRCHSAEVQCVVPCLFLVLPGTQHRKHITALVQHRNVEPQKLISVCKLEKSVHNSIIIYQCVYTLVYYDTQLDTLLNPKWLHILSSLCNFSGPQLEKALSMLFQHLTFKLTQPK